MAAIAFDPLEYTHQLEASGVPREQAEVHAKTMTTMFLHNLDALANEQTSDRILDRSDAFDKFLAILDQGAMFSHFVLGNVNLRKQSQHCQTCQLERVVLVRLAFDILPQPGFVVRAANYRFEPQLLAQSVALGLLRRVAGPFQSLTPTWPEALRERIALVDAVSRGKVAP